ncbi:MULTISPECIES: MerR family DNA-binding transcriptional regulator [unclassified Paenibacillus]|uniref:MerR family DNA-binding transcriptional regulator n=1 Tax=unclassified Paenibacillus TaxID=185978 RepID=UPI001F48DA85|nr:MerR family DNA-binding transcriptional regulator [Paenibacillus sp. JJ-223]CAH1205833.1 hypothetical protein PAECIP111890_02749 [Paenibacillus sp. JJ-223]
MDRIFTPSEMASALNVSTTTLRRYEEQGLIPDVPRTPGNRRTYMGVHLHAFVAIRSLLSAYDIPVVYAAMREIRQGEKLKALWLVNGQLTHAQSEKERVEKIWSMLRDSNRGNPMAADVPDGLTIGKAAGLAGVNASAIRHWEKEGLIHSERDPMNGYRIYPANQTRRILLISSLRKTVYYIGHMKQLLELLEERDPVQVESSLSLAMTKLNERLVRQYAGIQALMRYIEALDEYKS